MRGRWLAVMVVVLLAGCSDVTVPLGWRRQPALVEPYVLGNLSGKFLMELPRQAVAGRPVTIVVNTLSLDSCIRRGDTAVEVSGLTVEIYPHDLIPRDPTGCRQNEWAVLRREVTVVLRAPGPPAS